MNSVHSESDEYLERFGTVANELQKLSNAGVNLIAYPEYYQLCHIARRVVFGRIAGTLNDETRDAYLFAALELFTAIEESGEYHRIDTYYGTGHE